LLAWILEYNGLRPGFLIGGVPANFGVSARLGESPFFVVEADEYDTAFFDKRSKFVHYHPRTLVINNIEFDHADIFANLEAIQTQFHHLVRTVPNNGLIIKPAADAAVEQMIARGCWTPTQTFGSGGEWQAKLNKADGSEFTLLHNDKSVCSLQWELHGQHNVSNALAAIAAAHHAGVPVTNICESLSAFKGIKRRMEVRAEINGITVYDDFAHHPTAIQFTLQGLRAKVGSARIIAILEPRSNTMRMGVHAKTLAQSLSLADQIYLFEPANMGWSLANVQAQLGDKAKLAHNIQEIIQQVSDTAASGDQILIMSNGGFEGLHQKLIDALKLKFVN
jgi:UDP-N-acetylmuramate: L-alanyl-gamma-D-glutamyl-meso-diaminopimelate ligase